MGLREGKRIDPGVDKDLRRLLPGGHGRSTFALGDPIPYVSGGSGCTVTLDDGRELIDLNNNFTALVHGHAPPAIVAEVQRVVARGSCFGLPNHEELLHAETLISRLPGIDQVRYTNSGTEAVMVAIRAARARTGRDACVFVDGAYHGISEPALLAAGGPATSRGIPQGVRDDVFTLPINDCDRLWDLVSSEPDRFAALVVDCMPNRAGLVPISSDFVALLGLLQERFGVVLIVDEVIGFRTYYGGHYAKAGIRPDLVALGKLIGGGYPVGAVAGTTAVMAQFDGLRPEPVEHAGTFSGNPVTMAAGKVAMRMLDEAAIDSLNALGDRARADLSNRLRDLPWEVRGEGSLLRLYPALEDRRAAERRLWWSAIDRGVLLMPNGLGSLSTPMDAALVDDAVERVADAAVEAAAGTGSGIRLDGREVSLDGA